MHQLILEIQELTISFRTEKEKVTAVDRISFSLKKGITTGIVGESGSGKSVTALSLLKLLPEPPASINAEKIALYDAEGNVNNLISLNNKQMQNIRGKRISMIFQEPMSSLNPVTSCGNQVVEAILAHTQISKQEARQKTLDLFREVLLPDPLRAFDSYPHELSGGQRQRVMIAMAVSSHPDILIADEPTTALDLTVQKSIIKLLRDLQAKYGMAILFITHDLSLIKSIADEVIVMKEGKIVESGLTDAIFSNPEHPYTMTLLESRHLKKNTEIHHHNRLLSEKPLLEIKNLKTYFKGKHQTVKAVDGVDLHVFPGEVLGLVGESGCGKTTLGRSLLRLTEPTSGEIRYGNLDLVALDRKAMKKLRKEMQIIFQDPYSSLNPKMTIGAAITEPLYVHGIGNGASDRRKRALELLGKVGLEPKYFDRYPHELSGGQRQRVCIARALSVNPKFIVCDESVSALDVTIQAQVLKLLKELKDEFGFTYIFISHDLSVVRYISDRIAVMKDGKIVETGAVEKVYNSPETEYTKTLIESITM